MTLLVIAGLRLLLRMMWLLFILHRTRLYNVAASVVLGLYSFSGDDAGVLSVRLERKGFLMVGFQIIG